MAEHDRIARSAHMIAALLLAAGLAACGERISDTRVKAPEPTKPESSAVVIGQAPAEPKGDPPGTTPVAPNTTYIDKATESRDKPQEGDNHSYSTTAKVTPQKAEYVDPQQGGGKTQ
jgi:hypothetical protein